MTKLNIFGEKIDPIEKAYIVENMPIDEYHDLGNFKKHGANTIWSKSQLPDISCPSKFYYKHIDGNKKKPTNGMNIGNAVHTLALEPKLFHDCFYVLAEGIRQDARTEEFKACLAEANGRKIIRAKSTETMPGFDSVQGMAKSLTQSRKAMKLLEGTGMVEASIFYTDEETGLKMRTRPDKLRQDNLPIDIKTGHSANPSLFFKAAYEKHYDVSVAMTSEAIEKLYGKPPENYIFLVIESSPPFIVEAYDTFRPMLEDDPSDLSYLDLGKYRLKKYRDQLHASLQSDRWPSYSERINPMKAPYYAIKNLERGDE